jgi:hypothetical protein
LFLAIMLVNLMSTSAGEALGSLQAKVGGDAIVSSTSAKAEEMERIGVSTGIPRTMMEESEDLPRLGPIFTGHSEADVEESFLVEVVRKIIQVSVGFRQPSGGWGSTPMLLARP